MFCLFELLKDAQFTSDFQFYALPLFCFALYILKLRIKHAHKISTVCPREFGPTFMGQMGGLKLAVFFEIWFSENLSFWRA